MECLETHCATILSKISLKESRKGGTEYKLYELNKEGDECE